MVLAVLVAAGTIGTAVASASDDIDTLRHLMEACPGVVIVVDPGPLGGQPTNRCVTGEAGDGIAVLSAAGHRVGFVPGVPGMVCTIDDRPDPCNGAPVSAYWSYWLGTDTGWTYSSHGAGFRQSDPETVEGWRFGDGGEPPRADPSALVEGSADQPSRDGVAAPSDRAISTAMLAGIVLLVFVLATTWIRSRLTGPDR